MNYYVHEPLRISEYVIYSGFLGILFLINPTIALIVISVILFLIQEPTKKNYILFAIVLAAWLGVINMTKTPASDQIYYAHIYKAVSSHEDILESIIKYRLGVDSINEIFFNIYSVLCYYIFHGSMNAYFFMLTFTIYFLHFLAILKLYQALDLSKAEIICCIVLLAFFTPFFTQTVHACRQFLACSFFIYAFSCRCVNGKNNWLFLILAFFTHNSSLFFIILSLIPQFYKRWNMKFLIIFLISFIGFVALYSLIGKIIGSSNIGPFSHIGQKLSESDNKEQSLFSNRSLQIYAIPMAFCAGRLLYDEYTRKVTYLIPVLYISLCTYFFIMAFSFAPTIQYRYIFYLYSFIPFVIIPLFRNIESLNKSIYCFMVTFFFSCRFFFYDDWGWNYAPLSETVLMPFISVWNTTYYSII